MGFMTEVSILNDRWNEIRKKPAEFVEQIYHSSISNGRLCEYVIGQTTVAKTHHADDLRVYYAARNSFFDAYPENRFDRSTLEYQLKSIKSMKNYLKICETQTKLLLAKVEGKVEQ